MVPVASDQGLSIDPTAKTLYRVSGTYVGDLLHKGNRACQWKSKAASEKFSTKVKTQLPIESTSFNIERSKNGVMNVSRNRYLCKLK